MRAYKPLLKFMKAPLIMSNLNIIERNSSIKSEPTIVVKPRKLQKRTQLTLVKAQMARQLLEQMGIEPSAYKVAKLTGVDKNTIKKYKGYIYPKVREIHLNAYGIDRISRRDVGEFLYWYPKLELQSLSLTIGNGLKVRSHNNQSIFGTGGLLNATPSNVPSILPVLLVDKLVNYGFANKMVSTKKLYTLAVNVVALIVQSKRADGYVDSNSHAVRHILDYDRGLNIIGGNKKDNCILYRTKQYVSSIGSVKYKYHLSRIGARMFREMLHIWLEMPIENVDVLDGDIVVPEAEILNAEDYDQVVILSSVVGKCSTGYVCRKKKVDNGIGRIYGLEVYLTSDKRKRLIKNDADIGCCLQSTVAGVIEHSGIDVSKEFPAHMQMVLDRSTFRKKLAEETGTTVSKIKEWLTIVDNGGHPAGLAKAMERSSDLKVYYGETRRFVDTYMEVEKTDIYNKAVGVSHKYNLEKLREKAKNSGWTFREEDFDEEGHKIFGMFFNMWIQRERTLREFAKKYCDGYAYDVHDAISSNHYIDIDGINKGLNTLGEEYKYIRFD